MKREPADFLRSAPCARDPYFIRANESFMRTNASFMSTNASLMRTNASFVLTKGADARVLREDLDLVADGANEKNRAAGLFA